MAGSTGVTIEPMDLRVTRPSGKDFVDWYLHRTSMAPFAVGREVAVAQIHDRVAGDMTSYLGPDGVDMPARVHCVHARVR